ncbi:MAG TPA: ExeM/NucH family extracellular endonuclease [Jiangellales bacterium]|nr:ExeM/NucH family extracellular endonuclease [Jiangellales bacterium]
MAVLAAAAMTTALVPSVLVAAPAAAASPDLVVSQVYGGGGNTGAPYTHDFVELFNRGTAPVSLDGMSVQYASATGTGNFGANSGQLTELPSVTLQPGQYYLIQQAAGVGNGVPLPAPDLVDATPIAMAAGAGKVALATGTTSLGCNGGSAPCSAEQLARIVDLVGYGNANFFEGSGAAPTLSNTTAALRAGGGCTDTDHNGADFIAGAPAPRNTNSPVNPCGSASPVINEFVANHVGTDTNEFIEVKGSPDTDYSAYSVLQIEGDGTGAGIVDSVHVVGTTNATGHWTTGFLANALENGTLTLLLVEAFTGAVGTDLDTNDDGTLDVTPWSAVADTVAVSDGGAGDLTYSDTVLAPGFGGSSFTPGGASRIPDGADTDAVVDWALNDFDGEGLPGFTGTPQEGEALNTPGAPNALVEIVVDECDYEFTPIHAIQGDGPTFDPACGGVQTVEAVVIAVEDGLNGFYLQEEDTDVDDDPATSEGIFVFGASTVGVVSVGDLVRVTGTVAESNTGASSQTQLTNATVEVVTAGVPLPDVTAVTFPVPSTTYLERFEGMRVELVDELVISEYFNYDRFGEVVLAKPLDGQARLHTPTAVVDPGPPAQALAAEQALRIITLDDKNSAPNPGEIPHPGNGEPFSLDNRFRGGDTVTAVVGVIDHTFGLYRIQPTEYGAYEAVNPRPVDAPDVGGSIQVASFNVLNYFLTIDRGGQANFVCGANQAQECRGADTEEELERQRIKILAALAELDADVVGLMEMENTPGVEPAADLADGLNDILGAGTYGYVDTGVIGTDAIRLGFLYKPGTMRPAGDVAILDSTVDERFVDTLNRPMLTQTFDEVATGARVTVSVNHLKSKGSACAGDPDIGDGQGNCNLTRTRAAEAIVDFLATDPTRSGDPDHLVIGDLNSYDHEDPIRALETAGYTDLVKEFGGEFAYGYVFDGKVGYLDHALSNSSLTPQVTGAAEWHINADEPDILDYDMTFKPDTIDELFEENQYRSSDHDPVLVGLDLDPVTPDRCYADGSQTVDSYEPGLRANGTAVPPGHTDATQALGLSDAGGDDPYWVTLGLEGEIVLEFARPVQNNNGVEADLRVVDAADGAKGSRDAALVYGSWDGVSWVDLGRVTGTDGVDMGALPALRYVKVVDDTPAQGNPATDGYDLDAVEVLTGCV